MDQPVPVDQPGPVDQPISEEQLVPEDQPGPEDQPVPEDQPGPEDLAAVTTAIEDFAHLFYRCHVIPLSRLLYVETHVVRNCNYFFRVYLLFIVQYWKIST